MNAEVKSDFNPDVPTSEEFVMTMGRVCWLMSMSKDHRSQKIDLIEAHISAPLMFKQVRVYMKEKQPLAAIVFGFVSPEVKAKLEGGNYRMALEDWRSGSEVVVVECISPIVPAQGVIDTFMSEISQAQSATRS